MTHAELLELICLLQRATADLEKHWPEAAYDAIGRALRLAKAAERAFRAHVMEASDG